MLTAKQTIESRGATTAAIQQADPFHRVEPLTPAELASAKTGPVSVHLGPQLRVKRLHPDAIIPKYQTAGAACFDLHVVDEPAGATLAGWTNTRVFRTGLAFEVPVGYAMMLYSRSSHGFKHDVRMSNCVGVIDSDYRGELRVKLTADNGGLVVRNGDRIAQAMLVPVEQWAMVEVDELSDTARGVGGYGSTGK